MKVLFVIKQIDFADHIAIPHLAGVARELGWQTDLCVLDQADLGRKVGDWRPDVVAYSTNVLAFDDMAAAHRSVSDRFPFVSIMGGPHPTFSPETFPLAGVDAYCVGEGEPAFRDFLVAVENDRPFDDIPNLITAGRANEVRPLVSPLDELPFPDRDITLANTYLRTTPKKTFYATRGCPFSCSYCCNNYYKKLYRGKGPIVRRFSVERVVREIEYVRSRYCMDFIKFGDDLFAMKADEWLEEFAEKYAGRVGIPFNCYLRIDRVDDRLLQLLRKAGCYSVHLSIDSTSERIREEVLGRRMQAIDFVERLRLIHSFGINTWVNYMLAAPGSTLRDDLDTIALSRKGRVTYPSYSTTVPLKGTALYDYCMERDLIDSNTDGSDMKGCTQVSQLKGWSRRDRQTRYNIFLLGAIIAKLPWPLRWAAIQAIRVLPPNRLFERLRRMYYRYSIENRIFDLHRRDRGAPKHGRRRAVSRHEDNSHGREVSTAGRFRVFQPPATRSHHWEEVSCSKEAKS